MRDASQSVKRGYQKSQVKSEARQARPQPATIINMPHSATAAPAQS
ncbi:Uncharacterised protein [Cronobacter sakazakii]|nr:Uncharacterised protein [Cronobacter sakazakii]